jgi:hypothetical protein
MVPGHIKAQTPEHLRTAITDRHPYPVDDATSVNVQKGLCFPGSKTIKGMSFGTIVFEGRACSLRL